MTVVSVSLPDSLADEADAFIKARGYAGRSELVRAALREFLSRHAHGPAGSAPRSATLTLLYPDGFERKIADIRHDFTDVVQSMMHAHAGGDCVEVFILGGPAKRIQSFADALRQAKETRLVEPTYTDVQKAKHHHPRRPEA